MNFRKVISVVAVAAVAASTMAMPALAVKTTKIEAIKLDPATEETKLAQWPVNCLASAGAVNTVTIKGTASVADWCGGGGAFGFEAADGWKQVDFKAIALSFKKSIINIIPIALIFAVSVLLFFIL